MQVAGIHGLHACGRNACRNTSKWHECGQENVYVQVARSIHSMSHPEDTPKLREHPINIEEVNSKSKLKSTLVHFWGLEQIVKRSKIICSVVHNALFYACCGNAF
jgi:hypothetical protein